MAKPVKCCFCRNIDLKVNLVKVKTPKGEEYACPHHPGVDKIKIEPKSKQ